jgi:16S rRNA G527 N7-methylase RsmG
MQLNKTILDFVAKRDDFLNKKSGLNLNDLRFHVEHLEKHGWVEVGYRQSCGTADKTQKKYAEWVKVVAKIRKEGFNLIEEKQKHGNSYATLSGGFWSSTIYRLSA